MYNRSALLIVVIVACCLISAGYAPNSENSESVKLLFPDNPDCKITGQPENTLPNVNRKGRISVEGFLTDIPVDPCQVKSLRPDIFNEGYFSLFDCLVHVCREHNIEIKFHFDRQLRTHLIDSIGKKKNWWYAAIYHGGGRPEEPVHRMDTHPYKDWMRIEVYQVSKERIDRIYSAFGAEAGRLRSNKDKVIIPEVLIQTPNQNLKFTNVQVKAHGIRSDMFKGDVITAADIMLSLAKKGKLSLDLLWRGQFGRALIQGYYYYYATKVICFTINLEPAKTYIYPACKPKLTITSRSNPARSCSLPHWPQWRLGARAPVGRAEMGKTVFQVKTAERTAFIAL